jgi:hypothetical protein
LPSATLAIISTVSWALESITIILSIPQVFKKEQLRNTDKIDPLISLGN